MLYLLCRFILEFLVGIIVFEIKEVGGGVSFIRNNIFCNKLFYCYFLIVGYLVKN